MLSAEELMGAAIAVCRDGIQAGQTPFGCAIAVGDRIVARCHNTVLQTTDVTAHAEINAIRRANREVGDILLPGAVVATTCEPCPMCMTALHWARVDVVYYGATIADAERAGFNELRVSAGDLLRLGESRVKLRGDVLVAECRQLFAQWASKPQRRAY